STIRSRHGVEQIIEVEVGDMVMAMRGRPYVSTVTLTGWRYWGHHYVGVALVLRLEVKSKQLVWPPGSDTTVCNITGGRGECLVGGDVEATCPRGQIRLGLSSGSPSKKDRDRCAA